MRSASGRASLLAAAALIAALLPAPAAANAPAPDVTGKLRSDLAALVSGTRSLDPRIGKLVAGYRPGEIAYFARLSEPNDASHRAALESLGARVLRSYRTLPVVALASSPTTVLRVAAKQWVTDLSPVELVFALADPVADQTRGTPADVGAPAQWAAGITGAGVRIAILDTGVDITHPDLDDLDFQRWSSLLNDPKIVQTRDFNGGVCKPIEEDGHGHGSHVAGVAAGTGEGTPLADDNGKYAGVAPDAQLAVGKVLTDSGVGINSDLIAAMEWAAMPDAHDAAGCGGIGADIVNMSLGSEARPGRLNSDSDVDMISLFLDHLAVQYGTLFVAAAGNSGPYIGSLLEAPGAAAQALSVAATAKDYDLNHDDTYSGDTCSGWQHPASPNNRCDVGPGTQPASLAPFSSRGPSGDLWLRPDIAAPGMNIVSVQASTGTALAQNDVNRGTRADPLYATASGTSMATPAAAGSAALLLQAYRARYGTNPVGASGTTGRTAPTYALLRAAMMNSAGSDLYDANWILTVDSTTAFNCPQPDPLFGICSIPEILVDLVEGSEVLSAPRNHDADPYVGPLGEGAGKVRVGQAVHALRDGIVVYSAGSGSGATFGTGHRDFQGSWQVGAVTAGSTVTQRFVIHAAPGAGAQKATFTFEPGNPSDGSRAIPTGSAAGAWSIGLPGRTSVSAGGDAVVTFSMSIPAGTPAGTYTGRVLAVTGSGQVVGIPVFASVALHDPDTSAGNAPGPQAVFVSGSDVYAKDDTTWPSVGGTAPTGTNADWLVFPVELGSDLSQARFSVYGTERSDTYDLYLYDSQLALISSTHPFLPDGSTTDVAPNNERGPSTQAAPQLLVLDTPASGRHYVVVSRSRVGGTSAGASWGAFRLTLDEVRTGDAPRPTQAAYEGDYGWTSGTAVRLAARLTNPATGQAIAGRTVTFTVDDGASVCGAAPCRATTGYDGLAQLASEPITLSTGVHEVHVRFDGDPFWLASGDDAFVIVVGTGSLPPAGGSAGKVTAGGWFLPDGGTAPSDRIHFAFEATSPGGAAPTGSLRYRDAASGLDLELVAWTAMLVDGDTVTLTGSARDAGGTTVTIIVTATDAGEPGRAGDTLRMQVPDRGYDRAGRLGGGNVQIH